MKQLPTTKCPRESRCYDLPNPKLPSIKRCPPLHGITFGLATGLSTQHAPFATSHGKPQHFNTVSGARGLHAATTVFSLSPKLCSEASEPFEAGLCRFFFFFFSDFNSIYTPSFRREPFIPFVNACAEAGVPRIRAAVFGGSASKGRLRTLSQEADRLRASHNRLPGRLQCNVCDPVYEMR